MKLFLFTMLMLCTSFINSNKTSTESNKKKSCYFIKNSGHLTLFGLFENSIPQNTWYYFGEHGQLIKTRSQFKVVKTKLGAYFQCLERNYNSHGQLINETQSLVLEEELIKWPPTKHNQDYFKYKTDRVNFYSPECKKEGIWQDQQYNNCYIFYTDGIQNGVYYSLEKKQLDYLCEFRNNEFSGVYYGFLNEGLSFIISNFTHHTAYMTCFYSSGEKKSEGLIGFAESFEIDYKNKGVWKYYDNAGNIIKTDTFPSTIRSKDIASISSSLIHVAKD